MPFTRQQAKKKVQDNVPKISESAHQEGGGTTPGASALVPPCVSPRDSTPASMVSLTNTLKSTRSSKSSDTVKAQILAAKADHARKLAQVEAERERAQVERERAQAERERAQAERERAIAEIELQAELAAIEAGASRRSHDSSRHSRGSSRHVRDLSRGPQLAVEDWLRHPDNVVSYPNLNNNAYSLVDRRKEKPWFPSTFVQELPRSAPATVLGGASAPPQPPAPAHNLYVRQPSPARHSTHALGVGTLPKDNNCNCYCYKNKNNSESVGTPFIQLAKAITDLGKKTTTKVCDIFKFDGRAADWLPFKKSYDQSKAHFSPSDNVARLGAALYGAAREAVSIRLVAADNPDEIMQALETRFAQPEFIVLHQLSLVRGLARLGSHETPRDLNVFACRIRNCVEVIRLLDQPEYLASPELVNSIIGKLTPLLRSRWADFALTRVSSGKFKLENLADFLDNEAYLQTKFGVVMPESTTVKCHPPPAKNQSQPQNKDKIFPYTISSDRSSKSDIYCKYCSTSKHEIGDCEKFQSLSLDERWQWVLDNKVCRRCLKKGSHLYKNCKKRCKAEGCQSNWRHHTLLHRNSEVASLNVEPAATSHSEPHLSELAATVAHSAASTDFMKPLLKVIPVTLTGKKGSIDTYALLDDGSSATLVDKSVADKIVDEDVRVPLQINCVGGLSKLADVSFINISVRGRFCSTSYNIRARSIPNLGLRAQSARIQDIKRFKHLADLVDVLAYDDAKPTCLIGTDNWHLLLPQALRRGLNSEPAAAHTALGWALFGFIDGISNPVQFVNHVEFNNCQDKLDSLIKSYYKLDSIGIQKEHHRSPGDKRALEILEETTVRLPTGRFETGLLWRNDLKTIPESKPLALSRFSSLERKMAKDKDYAAAYKQNIRATVEKGYAELCTSPPSGDVIWYLPHFGVIHPHKKKLRVVHDAAARCNGVSLNSMLLPGPDLLQPLLAIVMRFREGSIALTADIREMFPQIKIRDQDRDAQRFFWRDSPEDPIQEYRMSSMIFGATSSPCTALYLKNKNACDFQHLYPEAARSIMEDHYMDDYLGSVNVLEDAARLAMEIVKIHKEAGFEMRSRVSNNSDALSLIPPDLRANDTVEVGLGPSSPSETRVLGLTWLVSKDSLCFLKSLPKLPETYTKRSTLSLLMSIYDPLGFMTPLVIKGRIMFQKTWKLGLDWDHSLPENLIQKWKLWFHELESLSGSSIPRCYSGQISVKNAQLHVFADASESAYACVAYWRFTLADGSVKLSLIGGKARLAPLKPTTVPRLELQAALIAARFAVYISDAHRVKPSKMFLWSDSITVLKWLRSDACTFKPFVSFRVGEISDITDIQAWRYVPTSLNVADDATRDSGGFSVESRWLTGPSFLLSPEDSWPSEPTTNSPAVTEENKVTSESVCALVGEQHSEPPAFSPIVADYRRFSKWLRLLRATARAHQAANIFRSLLPQNSKLFPNSIRAENNLIPLTNEDLSSAERHLFSVAQFDSFAHELTCVNAGRPVSSISKLKNVSLLLGQDGLLRLSGRTTACNAVEANPVILDGKHQMTKLLISSYHARFAHANNELVVNELHQRFYITGLRSAVKQVASRCQACRIRKAKPTIPPTGDLPDARMAHHERPFTYVGLDYFGPVTVTIGRRNAKRWIALFTCLTIRAVHLEMVESLSSDSAIMALRRFVARRGAPACIYSDNGTAFVGAAKILRDVYEFAAVQEIRWKFIPPSAPFMGGCWERLVRNVKCALNVTLLEKSPREEVLATLLAEAEAIVNSRPLTHVSVDQDSETALTPFTFLIGSSSNDIQTRQFDDSDLSSRAQWRKSQRLADHFWQRFVSEYLPTLTPRRRSTLETQALKVGDVVCIADGTLPRRCWPRGRVVATYPGKDAVVRVVDIATKGGVLRRHVRKVALLIAA